LSSARFGLKPKATDKLPMKGSTKRQSLFACQISSNLGNSHRFPPAHFSKGLSEVVGGDASINLDGNIESTLAELVSWHGCEYSFLPQRAISNFQLSHIPDRTHRRSCNCLLGGFREMMIFAISLLG
jgi:hypothetical protein